MNRWEAFQFICATLRASLAGRRLDIPSGIDWQQVIALAGAHVVTPIMAPPLVDHADVPSDVRDYLAAVQTLTAQKVRMLRTQIAEVTSALRGAGVQPVLLKGAAAVAQELYPVPGVHLMGDIDVLVDSAKMEQSRNALLLCGYRQHRERRPLVRDVARARSRDLAPVHEPPHDKPFFPKETGVSVELHHALFVPAFTAMLPASDALRRAIPVSASGMEFSVLGPTDRALHHVVHAQLHHAGAERGIDNLRQLVDLAVLVDAIGREIDWTNVEDRFAANGHAGVLADYLAYLAVLLDRRVPARISDFNMVMAHLRAGIEAASIEPSAKPGETIGAIASEYWRRLLQQPSLTINLLDPRFWPGRLRTWYDRLQPGRF